ncbi:MAG: hypothetical protein GEU74_12395 [Nitriliruptorales bacterium]|nr:hypothetical protein [Nitriliruptorales bacterium]
MTNTFAQPVQEVPRDRWGRPLVRDLDTGKLIPYRRATTFIDVLEDKFALNLWSQRMVATGLASRPDLLMKAAAAGGDKKELNQVVEAAREAGGASQAATTGSALHSLTEQLDRGQEPLIPPSAQLDIDAYTAATKHMTMRDIEVFVVDDQRKVGGTFDRVVELDDVAYVADLKTGKIDYGQSKIAMQLAVYAGSHRYDPATGERSPLDVNQDRGLVIHLPAGAGECTLHWAALDQGREGLAIAEQVWAWRSRQGLLEATPPGPDLFGLIDIAGDRESLKALWLAHQDVWTDLHTAAVKRRLAALQTAPPAPAA